MSLTLGHGPLTGEPAAETNYRIEGPRHRLWFEASPRRVRGVLGGETVVDSRRTHILHETGHLPVYYFPRGDVRTDLLRPSDKHTHCPFKGEASYWSVEAGGREAADAVWGYPDPLASSRHLRVSLGGRVVAESARPVLLFETGLPTRYYLPREDVETGLLVPSDTTTQCPYKGVASYHSLEVDGERHDDLVWTYREPTPAVEPIRDRLAFFNEKVDLEVDGEAQERPRTKWS